MKSIKTLILFLIMLVSFESEAQNAPVTIAPTLLEHGPSVSVPVRVYDFYDIGAISLTLDYDYGVVQATGVVANGSLNGFTADWTTIPGRIVMGWYGSSGVTLPDYSILLTISFTGLVAGETDLTWVNSGSASEYAKYDNGEYNTLNDDPTSSYFTNGHIKWQRPGPQTIAPVYYSDPEEDICIPVKVTQFTDVGGISLTMDYDPMILVFQSVYSTTLPLSWSLTGQAVTPGRLIVGGLGPNIASLPDSTILFYACFHYSGGTSDLTWWDGTGTDCEYADGVTFEPLADSPFEDFYIDGVVSPLIHNAPNTIAPTLLAPGPNVDVPIYVNNFVGIGAVSLTLDYDYSIVQITGIVPNVNLPGFTADWTTIPGRIVMGWFGSSGVTLPDYSVLVTINFTGLVGGETDLTWINQGSSSEYARYDNGWYNTMIDDPTATFYLDGNIKWQRPGPQTIAPVFCSEPDQDICIPVTVNQFSNIGGVSLTLDYNPSVLVFQNIHSATIPGSWTFEGQAVVPGRLVVGGIGPGITSLPDGSVLFYACFHYIGGTSALTWWDNDGTSCEYADDPTLDPLADRPFADFYFNGMVGPPMLNADFEADNTTPVNSDIVKFTDLSTGSPTSWDWSFDKPVVYMNGTDSHSQEPQVKFSENCLYTVTLVIHNSYEYCSSSEVKTGYIRVGISGLWTGNASIDWYTPENWDNCMVPDGTVDVTIPSVAPNWPFHNGDFTIGVQCKTISLESGTSLITINGALVRP